MYLYYNGISDTQSGIFFFIEDLNQYGVCYFMFTGAGEATREYDLTK